MKAKRESQWQDLMVLLCWLLESMREVLSCSKQTHLVLSSSGKQELLEVVVRPQ